MTSNEALVSSLEKVLSKPVFQKAIAKALAESLASTFEDIQQDRADLADHMAQAATPTALQTGQALSHTIVRGTGNPYWDGTRVDVLAVCGKTKKCRIRKVYGGEITWTDCDAVESPDFGDSKEAPPTKPSKTQPPIGYRMLGDAKDEPRYSDDLYWSLSVKDWIPIGFQMSYANRDNWAACRKIEEPPKRYREPSLEDLKNGPIECEVRDWDSEQWKVRRLITVHKSGPFSFLCKKEFCDHPLNWNQCRIEDSDK